MDQRIAAAKITAGKLAEKVNSMKFPFVVPIVGMMLLNACASDSGPAGPGRATPIVPAAAAMKSMDETDQAFMTEHFANAMDHALTGQTISWTNPAAVTRCRSRRPAPSSRPITAIVASSRNPSPTRIRRRRRGAQHAVGPTVRGRSSARHPSSRDQIKFTHRLGRCSTFDVGSSMAISRHMTHKPKNE